MAEAMRRAIGRASIALEQKGQKLGGLRYMSLDVKQLFGIAQLQNLPLAADMAEVAETGGGGIFTRKKVAPPPLPRPPQPEKITVTASVQCAFQIQ